MVFNSASYWFKRSKDRADERCHAAEEHAEDDLEANNSAPTSTSEVASNEEQHSQKHLDAYERTPVPESAFDGWIRFLGLFASRHTAGTEFAIGPLFVARGATTFDVVVGLAIGNLLAVLSWRFICAPIATRQRFTTYYAMERVTGRKLMYVYDVVAGTLLALLAGAMFTVSATAVGVLFHVPMPQLTDWLPPNAGFCVVVVVCGLVTTLIAAFGIRFVSGFGVVATPFLFAAIIYMGVQSLRMLGVGSDGVGLWTTLSEKVWTGTVVDPEHFSRFGFWHCLVFAWFCDLQLHIGQNDLSLIRFAKTTNIGGWSSAAGMVMGHYITWMIAGCMYAVQLQADPEQTSVAPGPIAQRVGGAVGLVAVIIAGWSTANPVLYSSGLAMQHALPKTRPWVATLAVGSLATVAALFPALTTRILEFLALAGLVLSPMGVILFADFWVLPRLGVESEMAHKGADASRTNWPAAIAWFTSCAVTLPLAFLTVLDVFFTPLVGIPLTFAIYVVLSKWHHDKKVLAIGEHSPEARKRVVEDKSTVSSTPSVEPVESDGETWADL